MITNTDAVTVFNGRTDSVTRRKKYIPTVVRGVSCVKASGSTVADNGVWSSDVQCKIRVPLDARIQEGRTYLPCTEYAGLDDGEAVRHWTIRKEDLVVPGEHACGFPLYEDEVARYIQENGLDSIRITEFADNTSGGSPYMKHWRIGGK